MFAFFAGHGDNVHGGTAQRRGVVECMQQVFFDVIEFAHQNKIKQVGLVLLFSYMSFDCMLRPPPDADQVFRRVRTTF